MRTLATGAEVLTSSAIRSEADADHLVASLARRPDVAYAERSRRVYAARVPNDPGFGDQFYLMPLATAIDASSAWDVTQGSAAIVVAVLDSGSTPHADLAGRLLPGWDFVSDPAIDNDGSPLTPQGDSRDADAADPGDYVTGEDIGGALAGTECSVRPSTWHGTAVIGAIAANADNGVFVTGVDWNARILPVRVLGKCYGDDPDVADAIMWAAGLPVPGVPTNTTPAQVINLSLGDPGPCPRFLQDAIAAALAHGKTRAIVAAAGNQNSEGDHFPSTCQGVISVASTAMSGNRAGYSNFGPRIDLAAPGGTSGGGGNGFLALSNTGVTSPLGDTLASRSGTSFATPLVSGVASLMLSVAPGLSGHGTARPRQSERQAVSRRIDVLRHLRRGHRSMPMPRCAARKRRPPAPCRSSWSSTTTRRSITTSSRGSATRSCCSTPGTTLKGWRRTGKTFLALRAAATGTAAVCRIYVPPGSGDGHFFGRDANECAGTLASHPSFISEDPAFFHLYPPGAGTCPAGTVPVYRVFSNRADANHRYATERAVRDEMTAKGWLAEGDGPDTVAMCAPAS